MWLAGTRFFGGICTGPLLSEETELLWLWDFTLVGQLEHLLERCRLPRPFIFTKNVVSSKKAQLLLFLSWLWEFTQASQLEHLLEGGCLLRAFIFTKNAISSPKAMYLIGFARLPPSYTNSVNACAILRPNNFDHPFVLSFSVKNHLAPSGPERQHWCANPV